MRPFFLRIYPKGKKKQQNQSKKEDKPRTTIAKLAKSTKAEQTAGQKKKIKGKCATSPKSA